MDHRPVFRVRLHGYDQLEVDNYTAWAEGELVTVRREVDHLLSRYGECSAELEISRRLLADAPRGREAFPVSERVQAMLGLAAEEAAALTDAGAQEAERLVSEARTEADARLRKARQIKEAAVEAADELLDHARRDRAAAAAAIEQARVTAEEILRRAAAERARLAELAARERDRAAADASARLATVRAAVDDLRRQHHDVRQSLQGLTDRLGEALELVADAQPEDRPRAHVMHGNVAVEADVVAIRGPSAPVPH
jgi:cell division septum initiation protein DivIVA